MTLRTRMFLLVGMVSAGAGGLPSVALAAEATPSVVGNGWVAIGIIVVLVAVIWFLISGSLGIAARDKSDDDEAGVGVLEGIDEDDDKPRKR